MRFKLLDKTGELVPLMMERKSWPQEPGRPPGEFLEWGGCKPPVRIQIHREHTPVLRVVSGNRVLVEQAFVQILNRNCLIASNYLKDPDGDKDLLVAFVAHLPQKFRGLPAFNTAFSKAVLCDHKRIWQDRNFAVEGLLHIRGILDESGIINDTRPDGEKIHYVIQGGPTPSITTLPDHRTQPD